MTIDGILSAVELGRKITLDELDRIKRRHEKLELEMYRLEGALEFVCDDYGKPTAGSVTVKKLPKNIENRPVRDVQAQGDQP